ncbi:MAG: hypothetical protein RR015_03605 [Bacteroidales bacterium]
MKTIKKINVGGETYEIGGASIFNPGDLVIAATKTRGTALSTRPYTDFAAMTAAEKELIVGIVVDTQKRTFVRVKYNIGKPLTGGENKPLYVHTYQGPGSSVNYLYSSSSMHPGKFDINDGRAMVSFIAQYTQSLGEPSLYNAINGYLADVDPHPQHALFYSDLYYNYGAQNTSDTNYIGAIKEVERVAFQVTPYSDKTIWTIYKEVAGITSDTYKLMSCTHSYFGDTQQPHYLFNMYLPDGKRNALQPYNTLMYGTANAYQDPNGVNHYYLIFDILP